MQTDFSGSLYVNNFGLFLKYLQYYVNKLGALFKFKEYVDIFIFSPVGLVMICPHMSTFPLWSMAPMAVQFSKFLQYFSDPPHLCTTQWPV